MRIDNIVFTGAELKEIIHSVDTVPVLKELWWNAVIHYAIHKKELPVNAREKLYEEDDGHPQLFV